MSSHDAGFEARAREVHARSLDHLSPRVQAQLAVRRREALAGTPARRPSRGLLPWAGMATAGLALALVLQLRPSAPIETGASVAGTSSVAAVGVPADVPRTIATLDTEAVMPDLSEDPEFYLWLGSERPADVE